MAKSLGVTKSHLDKVANGMPCSAKLALAIEGYTRKEVTQIELLGLYKA